MEKIITIIVPSYNMEKLLEKDLSSLIVSNTFLSLVEIIVVNDGSSDNTINIAKSFEERFPDTFVVIDKKNGNYGSCVNAGLRIAKGTFVKILDADDYFITKNFERMIDELVFSETKCENVDLFFFDWRYVDENDKVTKKLTFDIPPYIPIKISEPRDIEYFAQIQHHAIAYRTAFLRKNKYVQTERIAYTDVEWAYKPLLYVQTIKYCPIEVYSYFFGRADQSMSPEQIRKGFKSMLIIEQSLLKAYLSSKQNVRTINERLFKNKFISSIKYFYKNYLLFYPSNETIESIRTFDKELKDNCIEIYDELDSIYATIFRIRFIRAFRKKPNGLRYKSVVNYYKFRKFVKKCLGKK